MCSNKDIADDDDDDDEDSNGDDETKTELDDAIACKRRELKVVIIKQI